MAYIQSTINARSCCVMFLSFFFFLLLPVVSRSFVPPFSCVEKSLRTFWLTITEGSTQWTITVESLISMIHMHRGKWHWPVPKIPNNGGYTVEMRGGGDWHTDTSSECVVANFWGESTVHCEGRWRTAELSAGALSRNLTPYLLITLVSLVKLLFN